MKGWVVVERRKGKLIIWDWSYSNSKFETIGHMETIVFGEVETDWETADRLEGFATDAPFLRYARDNGFTLERAEVRLVKKEGKK